MKLGKIWEDREEITLPTLTTRHNLTESPLGKFFLALLEDRTWSEKYTVNAFFAGAAMKLTVHNENFLPGTIVTIKATDDLTIEAVENIVRKHLQEGQETVRPKIQALQRQVDNLQRTKDQIDKDKALAAIAEKFPEAVGARFLQIAGDLFAFTIKDHVFVARQVKGEFTGGVVDSGFSQVRWYGLQDGIQPNEKHGHFWLKLARQFAAATLEMAADNLLCEKIFAEERPIEQWSTLGKYDISRVILRIGQTKDTVVVRFSQGLPQIGDVG